MVNQRARALIDLTDQNLDPRVKRAYQRGKNRALVWIYCDGNRDKRGHRGNRGKCRKVVAELSLVLEGLLWSTQDFRVDEVDPETILARARGEKPKSRKMIDALILEEPHPERLTATCTRHGSITVEVAELIARSNLARRNQKIERWNIRPDSGPGG